MLHPLPLSPNVHVFCPLLGTCDDYVLTLQHVSVRLLQSITPQQPMIMPTKLAPTGRQV